MQDNGGSSASSSPAKAGAATSETAESSQAPKATETPKTPKSAKSAQSSKPQQTSKSKQLPNPPKGTGHRNRVRLIVSIGAAVVFAAVGFGVASAINGSSSSGATLIPTPPAKNATFVQDDNGIAADGQANLIKNTAPGLVDIMSASGTNVGLGLVLTHSGYVLVSDQVIAGAGNVTARFALSGKTYATRLVGTDAAADIALLKLQGGSGFKTISIGTASALAKGDVLSAVGGSGTAKAVTDTVGRLVGTTGTATFVGHTLSGLLETELSALPKAAYGGPLVNLSGQVVGIDLAAGTSGQNTIGFATTINAALTAAQQIAAKYS
jgi:putative serine protease PepD